MRKKDHIILAKYIIEKTNFRELRMYSGSFQFGSILPDLKLYTYAAGHTYEASLEVIQKKLYDIIDSGFIGAREVRKIGEIIHYVADFFTFPHNTIFSGNMKEHCRYEKEMRVSFKHYIKDSANQDARIRRSASMEGELFETLKIQHSSYLDNRVSIYDDFSYITSMALYITQTIYAMLRFEKESRLVFSEI